MNYLANPVLKRIDLFPAMCFQRDIPFNSSVILYLAAARAGSLLNHIAYIQDFLPLHMCNAITLTKN